MTQDEKGYIKSRLKCPRCQAPLIIYRLYVGCEKRCTLMRPQDIGINMDAKQLRLLFPDRCSTSPADSLRAKT